MAAAADLVARMAVARSRSRQRTDQIDRHNACEEAKSHAGGRARAIKRRASPSRFALLREREKYKGDIYMRLLFFSVANRTPRWWT